MKTYDLNIEFKENIFFKKIVSSKKSLIFSAGYYSAPIFLQFKEIELYWGAVFFLQLKEFELYWCAVFLRLEEEYWRSPFFNQFYWSDF